MTTMYLMFIVFFLSSASFAQTKSEIKCRIWKPENSCDIPDSVNVPRDWSCKACYWTYKTCEEINKKPLTRVWLTFKKEADTAFFLKSHFKNISIINKNDKKVKHPKAILWYPICMNDTNCIPEYMPKSFKAIQCIVNYKPKQRTDLILLFPEAGKGDKIIIDNFIETEIQY